MMYYFTSMSDKLAKDHHEGGRLAKVIKPISQRFYLLAELRISQADASNVVVFGKKLQLYPLIARRVWAVLDPTGTKQASFISWIAALRIIAHGSFHDKMILAFKLLNKPKVSRQDVSALFSEIGEFLSEAGNGITDAIEFLVIKSFAWDEIFLNQGMKIEV